MNRLHRYAVAALSAGCLLVAGCGGQNEESLLASARTYLQQEDYKAASIQLKAALQKNEQSGEARVLLGQTLLRTGNVAGAIVELERARTLKQPDDTVLPLLAEALLVSGQTKAVVDRFAQVTLKQPSAAAQLKATVAAGQIAQGQIEAGTATVEAALKLDAKCAAARVLKVRLMAGRGSLDEALAVLDSVISDQPKRPEPRHLKGEVLWLGKGDVAGATQVMRDVLAIDPRYLSAHTSLIRMQLQRHDIPGFKAQLAELKKVWPRHPVTLLYDAQLALTENDLKRAREGVQQLLRLSPGNVAALQLAGAIEFQAGALASAETHFNKVLQVSPTQPVARRLLAETHLRAGQPAKAMATLQPLLSQPNPDPELLSLAAQAHLLLGDLAASESYFSLAAKANPKDAKVRTALALTELAKGRADAGFAQLESVAASDSSTFADLALVSVRMRRGELDEALKAVDRLDGKLPGKPLPHLLRGRIHLASKDTARARESFEKALAADAAYFPATAGLAGIDVLEKKPEQAAKRFEAILATRPGDLKALLALAELRQMTGAKPEDVRSLLVDAVKLNPAESQPRLVLIDHDLARREFKAALVTAQDAVTALPDDLVLLDALGRAQALSGESEQAISSFKKILTARPGLAEPHLRLADVYIGRKDYLPAVQSLQRALEINPNFLPAQRNLVRIAMIRKRPADAVQTARSVQKQRPNEAVGFLMEGEIHAAQRAWEPAIAAFRTALEKNSTGEVAARVHALYLMAERSADAERFAEAWLQKHSTDVDFLFHLGTLAMSRKDATQAEAYFRRVMAQRPDNASTLNNIALLLVEQGKPGALELAERANKLLPNQPVIMDTLAMALVANKDYSKALEMQQRVVEQAPNLPDYRLNLAKVLIAANQPDKARTELEKLASLGDKFASQAEVTRLLKSL